MTAKRIASYIGLTIFAVCVCITVVMMLRYSELKALTLLILSITAVIAAITYVIGKHLEHARQRNPAAYYDSKSRLSEKLGIAYLIVAMIWLAITEVVELGPWKNRSMPEILGIVVCSVIICFGTYELVRGIIRDKRETYKPRSIRPLREETVYWLATSAFLAILVGYVIWPVIPIPFHNVDNATLVFAYKALSIVGIWAVLILLLVGLSILSRGTDAAKYALPNNLPQVDGHTDSSLHANACWRGTWLAKERVWLLPVPVFGRGYWTRGFGKAWLAEEVLAFKPNN